MEIQYSDIEDAFMFAGSGQPYECSAYISLETGKTYYQSDYGDFVELPEDIDDPKYITTPHKTELDLGKHLVLNFAYEYLGDKAEDVEIIFRGKGAYSKFKGLLDRLGKLDLWYNYENNAQQKAIIEWCKENKIAVSNTPEYKSISPEPQNSLEDDARQKYLKIPT